MKFNIRIVALLLAASVPVATVSAATDYKVQTKFSVDGTEGWDYITVDSAAHRIYVSHGVRVNVLDSNTGKVVGVIEDTPGVHGIAIASPSHHGFTTNGGENKVSMFDSNTLTMIRKIDVGKKPDGIFYDAETDRIFTNNHGSHDITAIDAKTGEVAGTVAVGGDGEGVVRAKDGLLYAALEDKDEICSFDPKSLEVKRHLPLDGVKAPTGLAIDARTNRLFVGGHNKTMLVIDIESGKKIASFPTGSGTDAASFDPKNNLAFLSNGEGNITVVHELSADKFEAEPAIETQASAKTMTLDEMTGTLYLPAATVVTTPPADSTQRPKRSITPGSFVVLVVSK